MGLYKNYLTLIWAFVAPHPHLIPFVNFGWSSILPSHAWEFNSYGNSYENLYFFFCILATPYLTGFSNHRLTPSLGAWDSFCTAPMVCNTEQVQPLWPFYFTMIPTNLPYKTRDYIGAPFAILALNLEIINVF